MLGVRLEVEIRALWLALNCLDDGVVAAGVLICSDSYWVLNVLKESGHSSHSILAFLGTRLRGLQGRVCFQWVPAHCSLLRNERADEEAKKAAGLAPVDTAQRGRISFEVVKRLIWKQVKDRPPKHRHTPQVYSVGFRCLLGASRKEEVLLAQLRGDHSLLLGETRKRVQETLEHVLQRCPNLEIPRKRIFVQVSPPLSVMLTDQVDAAQYFQEVFDLDLPWSSLS
jgi:hypothetical protein